MTLGTRLVFGLSVVVAVVMGVYGANSLRHREQLVAATIERETEALARALAAIANDASDPAGDAALDRVLQRVLEDQDVTLTALVDSGGTVISGGPSSLPACVDSLLADRVLTMRRVWSRCSGRPQLVVLAPHGPGGALVITRSTDVIDRDITAARRRILHTSLALAVLASLAILLVLRVTLTRPLAEIMAGVRATGGPLPPSPVPIPIPSQARELRELAQAFNEMVERLEGKRQSLAREVEERIELDRRLRWSESFAALGRLTGGVAHELGSPLGVIGVRAESIQTDPEASAESRRNAAEISREVDRIARLVRDLIHVARRHGPGTDLVNLAELVDALVAELRSQAERERIAINLRLPPQETPAIVQGDATLLRHALYNVILNSIQALRDHTGTKTVEIDVQRAGEIARVAVTDSGPGIAAEHYPHLFEPFFTTRDVGEGSGLGLSISAGIAEEHGGALTLVPAPGGGVSAYLDLIAYPAEPEPSP